MFLLLIAMYNDMFSLVSDLMYLKALHCLWYVDNNLRKHKTHSTVCLLYTSDAADE